jgi:polyhydroxyalkanoate synthesis regulator phasin
MNRVYGNSILEYTIVGFLTVAVCVGAMLGLGKQMGTLMSDLKDDMRNQTTIAQHARTQDYVKTSHMVLHQSLDTYFVGMSAEEKLLLQSDLSDKLQTLGANGTTELLAKQLAVLANALLDKGEITEEQNSTLLQLANKGHDMALAERLVEDFVEMAGERKNDYRDITYEFQGKQYTPFKLAELVGYVGWYPNNIRDPFEEVSTAGPLLSDFQRLYQEADKNGSLNNPKVKDLVTVAAAQIVMTGELIEDNYSNYHNGVFNFQSREAFTKRVASHATGLHSTTICKVGRNMDGGTFCHKKGR